MLPGSRRLRPFTTKAIRGLRLAGRGHRAALERVCAGGQARRCSPLLKCGVRTLREFAGLLDDALMLVLLIWLFPLAILAVGGLVALLVRIVIEIAQRL
jgi:hypothetical protein